MDMEPQSSHLRQEPKIPWIFWWIFLLMLFTARLLYGGSPNAAMVIHQTIADAIMAGSTWGRQALAGAMDIPLLPTLGLTVVSWAGRKLHCSPGLILCAGSQAVILLLFLRLAVRRRQWLAAAAVIVLPAAVPFFRQLFLLLDPTWFAAIPFTLTLYHLVLWQERRTLQNLLMVAVCNGLLPLGGPALMVTAYGLAAMLTIQYRPIHGGDTWERHRGIRTLLWAPLLYCTVVWLLWNSLLFGSMVFSLKELLARLGQTVLQPNEYVGGFVFLSLFVGMTIASLKSEQRVMARCLLPAMLAVPAAVFLSARCGIFPAALGPMTCILFLCLTVMTLERQHETPRVVQTVMGVVLAVTIAIGILFPLGHGSAETRPSSSGLGMEDAFMQRMNDAPSREEVLAVMDRSWPDSRVILIGPRLSAVYPDASEQRFVTKMTWKEDEILAQSMDEQLFVLVPPPDGYFYLSKRDELSTIYENGRPWLFLEHVFSGGWQLWRSVVPPKGMAPAFMKLPGH